MQAAVPRILRADGAVWKLANAPTSSETQKLVVVSGASTGMGASAARELARQGFHVLAGVRRDRDADAIRSTGIEPVILDITPLHHRPGCRPGHPLARMLSDRTLDRVIAANLRRHHPKGVAA